MMRRFGMDSQHKSSKGSDTSSAIERIRSNKNVMNACLPEFLRSSGQVPKSMSLYAASDRPQSPSHSSFDRAKSVSPDIDLYNSFSSSIFDPSKDPAEIILRIRERDIYREDLKSFSVGGSLTRGIIDGCLSIIKQLNHDFLIKDEANDKVIISSTEFSQGIFCNTKTSNFHAPTYVMKYE